MLFACIADGDGGRGRRSAVWFVLCASDGIDGFLARRHGTTRSGAFLDPLADKVLVLGAMFTLVGEGVFPVVPVAIIAVREVAISLYRTFAGRQGVSVPASRLAKLKTVIQQLAVGFALFPPPPSTDVAVARPCCGSPSSSPCVSGGAVPLRPAAPPAAAATRSRRSRRSSVP